MRAWVVGFLLAVMSFQFAWAGIAVYCQHQADVVTDHIGHHEHEHAAVAADFDADDSANREADTPDANLGGVDNDCGFCHLNCAQPLATAAGPWLGDAAHELVFRELLHYSSREPEGLDRPNWQRLARSASLEEQRIT